MKILIDKDNRIEGYITTGDIEGAIEIGDFNFQGNPFNYIYENGQLIYSPNVEKINRINKERFFVEIDKIKVAVLDEGYIWRGHRQKCRDKDIGLMTATIESLRDYQDVYKQEMEITWYFEDNDGVKVKLKDMQELRFTGLNFIQKVYDVENKLKTSNIQKITKEKYLELLNM